MLSLKIQNIQDYPDELIKRIKKSVSLSNNVKKTILNYIKKEDWFNVVKELLRCFDGVTYDKILNYSPKLRVEISQVLDNSTGPEFESFCDKCYQKYFM